MASIFGGQNAAFSRIIYALVGLSGLLSLAILFDPMESEETSRVNPVRTGSVSYGTTEFGEDMDLLDDRKSDDVNKNQ